ncbi:MAG: polyribonucleotide nucleotidyltransferase [Patescibacteria group bacterium]|jgi:polyribonucleotide nucleotidyltransferase
MKQINKSIELAGRKLVFRIGEVAEQATAAVITQYGETTILTTVVVGKENPDLDYFPLGVEYAEKLYAGGRIKGSRWVKREGRPNDSAILAARLIDRSVRPLFDDSFRRDVQVINTVLSIDGVNSPEIVAALGSCCALSLCSIPWNGPVATLEIGLVNGEKGGKGQYIVNPTSQEDKLSRMSLIVSATNKKVVMIETKAEEVSNEEVSEGIKLAKKEMLPLIALFSELRKEAGVKDYVAKATEEKKDVVTLISKKYHEELIKRLQDMADKENVDASGDELVTKIAEEFQLEEKEAPKVLKKIYKKLMKELVLKMGKRADGRKMDQVRPLSAQVGVIPRIHGSAIFKRGATQVLSIATLGPLSLQQWIENPEGEFMKRYIHHYFMPPYSVGETGRVGTPNRREIGHGALAEKAIEPMLPEEIKFPYTVRIVSEVLSSNGSTSMASTCGSSLALMDAGVPIKEQVAGIAMGLVREDDTKYQILTDIIGIEDFFGEMDFKVAGTKNGITAIQLDVKNDGINDAMIDTALSGAQVARMTILDVMNKAIDKPRKELSKYAPRVVMLTPPADKIGEIIGPGGKNIKKLIADTGCEIDIDDDGKVSISGVNAEGVERAVRAIEAMSKEYKLGEVYEGTVIKILPFGAIVEIGPGKEGLLHVSQMGMGFVKDANEVFKEGQSAKVEVAELDDRGRMKFKLVK